MILGDKQIFHCRAMNAFFSLTFYCCVPGSIETETMKRAANSNPSRVDPHKIPFQSLSFIHSFLPLCTFSPTFAFLQWKNRKYTFHLILRSSARLGRSFYCIFWIFFHDKGKKVYSADQWKIQLVEKWKENSFHFPAWAIDARDFLDLDEASKGIS